MHYRTLLIFFFTVMMLCARANASAGIDQHSGLRPYYLDVYVNEVEAGLLTKVYLNSSAFCVPENFLEARTFTDMIFSEGIDIDEDIYACIAYDDNPDLKARHVVESNSLYLSVPPAWLDKNRYNLSLARTHGVGDGTSGRVYGIGIDYDARYRNVHHDNNSYTLDYSEFVFNGAAKAYIGHGVFNYSGYARWFEGGYGARWQREDTSYSFFDYANGTDWIIGDSITRSFDWSESRRVAGITVGRRFDIQPDLVTTPLTGLSGSSEVPSVADVYIDNLKRGVVTLSPGLFDLDVASIPAGRHQVTMQYRNAAGQLETVNRQIYVSPQLLQAGMLDYSFSLGFPRLYYSTDDEYSDTLLGSAVARYGFLDNMTMKMLLAGDRDVRNVGVGMVTSVGLLGEVELAAAWSGSGEKGSGRKAYISYAYNYGGFGLGARYRWERNFQSPGHAFFDRTYEDQGIVNASFRLTDTSSVTTSYIWRSYSYLNSPDAVSAISNNDHYLHVAFRKRDIFGVRRLVAGVSGYRRNDGNDWEVRLDIEMPLGAGMHARADTEEKNNVRFRSMELNGRAPGRDVHWGIRRVENDRGLERHMAQLDYTGDKINLSGNMAYGQEEVGRQRSYALGARGNVLATAGSLAFSNHSSYDSAAAQVHVGLPDVEVRLNNRIVGRSNADGNVLIPSLMAHSPSIISVNASDLPMDVVYDELDRNIVLKGRQISNIDFDIRRSHGVLMNLVPGPGQRPIRSGAEIVVSNEHNSYTTVAGYDSMVYLQDAEAGIYMLRAIHYLKDCVARVDLQAIEPGINRIQDVRCE